MRNENHRIGINNQKQPWQGVLNTEWKKSCWIILPKKGDSWYRSETNLSAHALLKQISLHMFLNCCTSIQVVRFVYFLSNLSRSRSSDLKAFWKKSALKGFRIERKTLVPESSFKVARCIKKETLAQVFLCKFHIVFKKIFVEAMFCRTSTEVSFWNSYISGHLITVYQRISCF